MSLFIFHDITQPSATSCPPNVRQAMKINSDFWLSRCCYAVVGLIAALSVTHMIQLIQTDWCISLNVMFVGHLLASNASMHVIIRAHYEGLLQTSGFRRCNHTPAPAVAGPLSACPSTGVNIIKMPSEPSCLLTFAGLKKLFASDPLLCFQTCARRATECKAGEGNVGEAGKSCSSSI